MQSNHMPRGKMEMFGKQVSSLWPALCIHKDTQSRVFVYPQSSTHNYTVPSDSEAEGEVEVGLGVEVSS